MAAHLFIDISSHGFGHLAQVAPVVGALIGQRPDLRLTLRTGLPIVPPPARLIVLRTLAGTNAWWPRPPF